MIQWLRRRFLAGFFVTVPLAISVFALYWIFGIIDSFAAPFVTRIAGDHGTVLGLSMPMLRELLQQLGVEVTDLWC